MKKRLLAVFLILVLTVCMAAGCKQNVGTTQDNAIVEEEEEAGEDETGTYLFGFSCISMENPYFITLEQSLRETVEAEGNTMITRDPADDPEVQISQIQDMIEEGIDAIFLCPVSWDGITPALEALRDAGVKIINVDTQVKELTYVDAYIGSDNRTAGELCAQDLTEQRPDGGRVVILESDAQNSVIERITGFEETIAGQGFEVVARADTKGELNQARETAAKIFAENDQITAVMCGNDQIALGALVAAHTAGLTDVLIYGVDGSPDLKKELLKSDTLIRGTSGQSPISIGKDAARTGMAVLNGEDYEEELYEDVFFITSENVDMYGADGWQ